MFFLACEGFFVKKQPAIPAEVQHKWCHPTCHSPSEVELRPQQPPEIERRRDEKKSLKKHRQPVFVEVCPRAKGMENCSYGLLEDHGP